MTLEVISEGQILDNENLGSLLGNRFSPLLTYSVSLFNAPQLAFQAEKLCSLAVFLERK